MLNAYLLKARLIGKDDVVVADGFWAKGLETLPLAVSHSHGIWSHLTKEDELLGRSPDMPHHHQAQVNFRKRWVGLGKPLTSVSAFITEQMRLQWGFPVDRTINNAVDTSVFRPAETLMLIPRPFIVHGVNDVGNLNKGGDHIRLLLSDHAMGPGIVLSLDEAQEFLTKKTGQQWTKAEALAQADIFVHPSGFEGNSMMVAEALACGIPFVGYDVGLMWWLACSLPWEQRIGFIMSRSNRSPAETQRWTWWLIHILDNISGERELMARNARRVVEGHCSIAVFQQSWREYVAGLERSIHA